MADVGLQATDENLAVVHFNHEAAKDEWSMSEGVRVQPKLTEGDKEVKHTYAIRTVRQK